MNHCEARILCRRTDECDDTFLDPWEQDILLALGPAMDLVEKEDSLTSLIIIVLCLRNDLHDIFFLREDS